MTVSELIDFLKTQPQDMQVIYRCYSEHAELEADGIYIGAACESRSDGWWQMSALTSHPSST